MSSSQEKLTDAALVERTQGGDPLAFEELMRRHYERTYAVIVRMVHDNEKARDLTQECFLRAWRSIGTFARESSFFTWLYQISRNLVISEARRERARPRIKLSIDSAPGDADDGGRIDPEASGISPDGSVLSGERRAALLDAIANLPPDFREVIVLRDVEDLSYEELAQMLEIPVGTVRSRLFRARAELKSRIADLLPE